MQFFLRLLVFLPVLYLASPAAAASARVVPAPPRMVALSFNDGPDGRFTSAILRQLAAGGDQATFFLNGRELESDPAWLLEIGQVGCEVGNHGLSHDDARSLSSVRDGIARAQQALTVTGIPVRLYRPQAGVPLEAARRLAHAAHLTAVLFNRGSDPGWLSLEEAARLAAAIQPGDIISLSDSENGYRALILLQRALHAQGLHAVTVSRLLASVGGR